MVATTQCHKLHFERFLPLRESHLQQQLPSPLRTDSLRGPPWQPNFAYDTSTHHSLFENPKLHIQNQELNSNPFLVNRKQCIEYATILYCGHSKMVLITRQSSGISTNTPSSRGWGQVVRGCLLYTSPSPRDQRGSRMPSSA